MDLKQTNQAIQGCGKTAKSLELFIVDISTISMVEELLMLLTMKIVVKMPPKYNRFP